MPTDVADPVSLSPYARPDTDLRVELHAHLKISFKRGFWDGHCAAHARVTLESTGDHGIIITLLMARMGLLTGPWCRSHRRRRGTIDRFVQDGIVWIVLLHGGKIIGAF